MCNKKCCHACCCCHSCCGCCHSSANLQPLPSLYELAHPDEAFDSVNGPDYYLTNLELGLPPTENELRALATFQLLLRRREEK